MLPEEQTSQQSTKKELNQVGVGGIKSLRTFQGDVAEALGKNNTTVAKMAIAENVRKAEGEIKAFQDAQKSQEPLEEPAPIAKPVILAATPQPAPAPAPKIPPPMTIRPPEVITNGPEPEMHSGGGKKVILFLFSLLLLSGGIFGGLYFYSKSPLANVSPKTTPKGEYRGLLSSDIQKKIVVGSLVDKRLEEILAYEKESASLESGQASELYFVKENEKDFLTAEEFLSLSTTRSPETVRRSLIDEFMFGFHRGNITTEPYLILKTEFFQNTFTGMLKWEPEMHSDTKVWLSNKQVAAGTAFVDRVIKNKDVRVLRDASSSIAIIYGFLDSETLIITTNEETFLSLLDRFEKQAYVR